MGNGLPGRLEGLTDVVEDVVDVLEADRQTDHAGVDARSDELLIGELTVGHACRMEHAGADVGNMYLTACELERVHELRRTLSAALDAERDDAAAAMGQILLGTLIIFVALQTRIGDGRYIRRSP